MSAVHQAFEGSCAQVLPGKLDLMTSGHGRNKKKSNNNH